MFGCVRSRRQARLVEEVLDDASGCARGAGACTLSATSLLEAGLAARRAPGRRRPCRPSRAAARSRSGRSCARVRRRRRGRRRGRRSGGAAGRSPIGRGRAAAAPREQRRDDERGRARGPQPAARSGDSFAGVTGTNATSRAPAAASPASASSTRSVPTAAWPPSGSVVPSATRLEPAAGIEERPARGGQVERPRDGDRAVELLGAIARRHHRSPTRRRRRRPARPAASPAARGAAAARRRRSGKSSNSAGDVPARLNTCAISIRSPGLRAEGQLVVRSSRAPSWRRSTTAAARLGKSANVPARARAPAAVSSHAPLELGRRPVARRTAGLLDGAATREGDAGRDADEPDGRGGASTCHAATPNLSAPGPTGASAGSATVTVLASAAIVDLLRHRLPRCARSTRAACTCPARGSRKRKRALVVGDGVVRRRDHDDVRRHVRVQVAAERARCPGLSNVSSRVWPFL